MKKNIVISLIGLLLACVSCDFYTKLHLKNNTSDNLAIYIIDSDLPLYIPTTISPQVTVTPNNEYIEMFSGLPRKFFKARRDENVIIYYFSVDTLKKYGWEESFAKDLFYQRYDVTYHDYEKMNGYFPVPPTPEMSGIRMWPPYGTYK